MSEKSILFARLTLWKQYFLDHLNGSFTGMKISLLTNSAVKISTQTCYLTSEISKLYKSTRPLYVQNTFNIYYSKTTGHDLRTSVLIEIDPWITLKTYRVRQSNRLSPPPVVTWRLPSDLCRSLGRRLLACEDCISLSLDQTFCWDEKSDNKKIKRYESFYIDSIPMAHHHSNKAFLSILQGKPYM